MKTDAQLQQDVIAELKWEPSVNATRIGVEVEDGIVTLAGHVGSHAEKCDAERAAQRVSGVQALAIEMDVALSKSSRRTDADIARLIESVLYWTTAVPQDSVKVMIERGWVTLSGEVEWEYQRQAAMGGVRYLTGVTGITDRMVIKPTGASSTIKSDIETVLKRRAKADAPPISVEVDGADVILAGTVRSWSEREMVVHSARGTPGVQNVVDKMTVTH
jgi:osmotically-inducible protein OsmY